MNKIYLSLLFVITAIIPNFGQKCDGTQVAVIMANGVRENDNQISFDVYIRNSGTTDVVVSGFGSGIIGLPKGIMGDFDIIQQPTNLNVKLNDFVPNFTAEIGADKMPIIRWTNNPLYQEGFPVSSTAIKVAKFRFTRTGGTELPAAVYLSWQLTNQTPAQMISYCNGNINPVTLATSNEGLIVENLTIYNNSLSSTSETKVDGFSVSPNPTTDIIRVDISKLVNNKGDIEMQVVDAAGSVVMVRELAKAAVSHTISLATLTPAPYFVKLTQDGKTYTKSVIKLQQ